MASDGDTCTRSVVAGMKNAIRQVLNRKIRIRGDVKPGHVVDRVDGGVLGWVQSSTIHWKSIKIAA